MQKNGFLPLIIAHRGASALAPENTLTAFRQAIEAGANGIEFDVRISKDGVPVVFHDSTLRRIARREGRTSNFTAEELGKIEIGSWFNEKFPRKANAEFVGEKIPTLEELFVLLNGFKGRIYLEMKGNPTEVLKVAEAVVEIIKNSPYLPQIIAKSFKLEAVAHIKNLFPEVKTAALFAPKILTVLRKQTRIIEEAKKYSADELSLHYSLATEKFVRRADDENMPTTIWTADHPIWVRRATDIGIRAIITNNPARLLKKREEL